MKVERICPEKECTGCFVCLNICPVHAIGIKTDFLGHTFPIIDEVNCINCGKCAKSCPSRHKTYLNDPIQCFAAWSKIKNDYLTCTSGGIATSLSRYLLSIGYIVYGAAAIGLKVRHIRCNKIEEIELLKGSKYVQSDISEILSELRRDLNQGLRCLFIGTPCQCMAIKMYLVKDFSNLILIDIICHGVPSQFQLNSFVLSNIKNLDISTVSNLRFRDRSPHLFVMSFNYYKKDSSQKKLFHSILSINNSYYYTFFQGMSYRNSCYNCQYANRKRIGDITLGDFWGVDRETSQLCAGGVSCVLINTDKGKKLIGDVPNIELLEKTIDMAVEGNAQLQHPSKKTIRTILFRCVSHWLSVQSAFTITCFDKIIISKMKVIIKKIIRKK